MLNGNGNGLFLPLYIKKYKIMYIVHRIKGKKWREGP